MALRIELVFFEINRYFIFRISNRCGSTRRINLDVRTILEGSVSRENHRIRVNAQLINVPDDSHLWSDTFERELKSVFDIQDEISRSIAETLQVKLSGEKSLSFESERPKTWKPTSIT